ncbi:hypothetical protein ACFWGN_20930 [Oerskovia sp. NPDC060338]|uniref:hypothetical protein n=1 Tax=Oerskovia sp. NPDC060338 TaxID=3347100 RepID=UPI0036523977
MATTPTGLTVPAGTDVFDPDGDMRTLAGSLDGRIIVPVANAADRDALAALVSPTPTEPLTVRRTDTGVTETNTGGPTWTRVAGPLTDLVVNIALWTSTLRIRQEVTAAGWRMTMRGRLTRTSGAFSLGGGWIGIGTIAIPADMRANVGESDLILTAQALPDGTNLAAPITMLLDTTTGAISLRSPIATQSWVAGGTLRLDQPAIWYRDL